MAALSELIQRRAGTTNPLEYDEPTAMISQAEKAEALARAQSNAEAGERQRLEKEQARAAYRAVLGEIKKHYEEMTSLDADLFEGALKMVEAMEKRTELELEVKILEDAAIASGASLGFTYRPPSPSLVGGPAIYRKPHELIKVWLQRVEDWRHRLGRTPTLAEVQQHGLQTGTAVDDLPNSILINQGPRQSPGPGPRST